MPKYVEVTWTVSILQRINDGADIDDVIDEAKDILVDTVKGYTSSQIKGECDWSIYGDEEDER